MFASIPVVNGDIDHFEMIDDHGVRLCPIDGGVECVCAHGELRQQRGHFRELECPRITISQILDSKFDVAWRRGIHVVDCGASASHTGSSPVSSIQGHAR